MLSTRHRAGLSTLAGLAIVIAACAAMIWLPGCGTVRPEEDSDEFVVSNETFDVDANSNLRVTDLQDDGIVLAYEGAPPDLEVGDILIGSENGGYLRKVHSLSDNGSALSIQTSRATLEDVILQGTLEFQETLDPWSLLKRSGKLEDFRASMPEGVTLTSSGWEFDDVDIVNEEIGGVDVRITIDEGVLLFTPDFELYCRFGWNGLKEFSTIATGQVDMVLEASASVSGGFSHSDDVELVPPMIVGVYWIPNPAALPIYMDVAMGVEAGYVISAGAALTGTAGAEGEAELRVGAQWQRDSGWDTVWDPDLDFGMTVAQWDLGGGATLRVFVRPYVATRLLGAAGPYVAADGYVDAILELNPSELCWYLHAGVGAGLGFEVSIFGWEIVDYYTTLADASVLIGWDCEQWHPHGTIYVNAEPDALNAPWHMDGPNDYSHYGYGDEELSERPPGEYTITWLDVSGYSTPAPGTQILASGGTLAFDGYYTPVSGNYSFVLTWGEDPRDLDAHLWVPTSETGHTHVYYGNHGSLTAPPYAELGDDDMYSYGPETITLLPSYSGDYEYAVKEYTGSGTLATSEAVVKVYVGQQLIQTLHVPTGSCEDGWWWHVVRLDAQGGQLEIINELHSYAPVSTGRDLPLKENGN